MLQFCHKLRIRLSEPLRAKIKKYHITLWKSKRKEKFSRY
ncbi:Uncharacterized protein dnm_065790 [Desulfonema magnum]|uniref:Uncharacterized protein n=1 Tax=Desulfonema magnum TaxID=45655 RepID=A0A975BQY1_9BACT|nr:Uncharacterized protein dnm_058940 [Desulfonema magnum]QTA90518.1 Uncharacterized protein dnm_065790 [Desulfonema magnum]